MAEREDNLKEQPQFCPFGICKGIDPNQLYNNNEKFKSVYLNSYMANMVFPPQPFIEADTYTGDLFEGIDYGVLYTSYTGVCAVSLGGSLKQDNLERFYQKVGKYLNVKVNDMKQIKGDDKLGNFTNYILSGEEVTHLREIDIVFLQIAENDIFGHLDISFGFWFDNTDECIKYSSEIAKIRARVHVK